MLCTLLSAETLRMYVHVVSHESNSPFVQVLPVCRSWEDRLWAYYNSLVIRLTEEVIHLSLDCMMIVRFSDNVAPGALSATDCRGVSFLLVRKRGYSLS